MISYSASLSYAMLTLNSSFKGVVFNYMSAILYENLINQKNFTLRICEETVQTNLFPFYFTKNFYLVNKFNELISNFQAAGLIGHVMSKYVGMNLMSSIEKQPPSALSYHNIEGFFNLFFFGCALSFVSFISEIIFRTFKQRKGSILVRCAGIKRAAKAW